jgi:hypothetical protein
MVLSIPAANAAAKYNIIIYTLNEKGVPLSNVKVFLSDASGVETYYEVSNASGVISKTLHDGFWYLFCDQFGIHTNLNISSPLIVYLFNNGTAKMKAIVERNDTKAAPIKPRLPMGLGGIVGKTPLPWLGAFSIPAIVVMAFWKTRVERAKESRGVK